MKEGLGFMYSNETFLNDCSKVLITLRPILAYCVNHQGKVKVSCSPFSPIDNLILLGTMWIKVFIEKKKKMACASRHVVIRLYTLYVLGPSLQDVSRN